MGTTRLAADSPLDVAEATFRLLTCAPDGLSLQGAALSPSLPARDLPLSELRDLLLDKVGGTLVRDAVWRELVLRSRTGGPGWLVATVGMALPALRDLVPRTGGGDDHDHEVDVLVAFLEALRAVDVTRATIWPRLYKAAHRAARHARESARAAEVAIPFADHGHAGSMPPPRPWRHPDLVLFDAVAKGVITAVDAELIGRTRLEDVTLVRAAAELGLGYEQAKKRRQRSEKVLIDAVLSQEVEAALSLTITPDGFSTTEASARGRRSSDTGPEDPRPDPEGDRGFQSGPARIIPLWRHAQLYPAGIAKPRSRRRIWIVLVLALVILLVAATAASAETLAAADSLDRVINSLRRWIVGLLVALATLMATIGGLRYLLAGGDPGEVAKAKNTLRFAALGYAIAALAPLLVSALKSIVGG